MRRLSLAIGLTLAFLLPAAAASAKAADVGTLPADAAGHPLNLDFETGTLKDWTPKGDAFAGQPIEGDTVSKRRSDMKSGHQGRFWVGTYERNGDPAVGALVSAPFRVTKPFASFLVGGGATKASRVELVRADIEKVIHTETGDDTEDLKRVAVDLSPHVGKEIYLRLVDEGIGGWGHLNFDDFRLHDTRPDVPNRPRVSGPDVIAHAGLAPEEAARAMTVPSGFHVSLFAGEPDVVQPIAMTIDDRGRVWVAEAYSYPARVPDDQAKDRILIFEDKDGDGKFDSRKVFAERLNLVSGLEVGFGGAWVGAAPHFMFIPDKDGDDRADGPPQILLDGWGQQDTHETPNSFNWGPDGWLYGCHGVFTHSLVGKPGTPEKDRVPINAGIWRYHPTKHRFEVFAHGTSNPWGVEFDERGQCFITACVIPHLYHMIQGGRYERQGGPHFNPYTYDDIKTIADHRHWVGASPHGGNGRSDSAGGGHAHSGAMIYLGGAWPEEYRGSLFMNNIHGARLNRDTLAPRGSGYVGSHAPDFLFANDSWSQLVAFRSGPDGNVYLIDWYDKNQCHRIERAVHDRTNGRIFKLSYGNAKAAPVHLRSLSDRELVSYLFHGNDWYARQARLILQERGPKPETREILAKFAFSTEARLPGNDSKPLTEANRLRALWALHSAGGLTEEQVATGLGDPSPFFRGWVVQLALEDQKPSSATLARLVKMAANDPSPVVRLYLSSAAQRLPLEKRWTLVETLVKHGEDATDHNLPLMYWYAAEPLAEADSARAARLAKDAKIPLIEHFMARRIGAIGSPEAIALLVGMIRDAANPAERLSLLGSLGESLKGRRQVAMPAAWPELSRNLSTDPNPVVRSHVLALGVTFGDEAAMSQLRKDLADASVETGARREALEALLKARDPGLAPTLLKLIADVPLRRPALRGLAAYDAPETPAALIGGYRAFTPDERRDALNTLAARAPYAAALLAAVERNEIPRADLSADLIRQMRNLKDKEIDERITKVWGAARETSEDKAKLIAKYKAQITRGYAEPPDVNLGRAVFAKTCAQCHTLFGTGGKVGPELTGSNRADLDYVLSNVLDPSALIGKDYLAHAIGTRDGRILTGIIRAEDKDSVTLVTANETLTLPKGDIEERKVSDQSMMPDDLWTKLSEREIRSLVVYLASPAQVPMLATAENASGLFGGRDLAGWEGNPDLWKVEDGEIVGRTAGLARNEFLRSDLTATDFRLTLKVKLVKDEGNSGIQFRSQALPDGEMKGDQADIGPGWWGKIYEENGRGLLWKESGEAHVKCGEWNEYEIVAIGPKIRTSINGKPCADLDDPSGARRGIFAFQLHSGGPTEVRFRDIKLEVIAPTP